jgi:carboxyl-terminal processing protease
MYKWRPPIRFLFVIIGLAVGALLAPSLSSCSVVGGISDNYESDAQLAASSLSQLDRFESVYNKYVISGPKDDETHDQNMDQFRDALLRVRYDYVRDVPESELVDAAIEGMESADPKLEAGSVEPAFLIEVALDKMMTSLDPHSSYLNPAELKEMKVSNRGEFGGLGITVTMDGDFVKVISPLEYTPAYRAGLKPGDLISHLDGEAIKGKNIQKAVSLMRGKPGTVIRLTINRAKMGPFDVEIRRAIIKVKSVRWHLEGDVGYIRVVSFTEKVAPGIDAAMEEITNELGDKLAGVVLDLRSNPGGLLHQSLTLSDAFLEGGVIVSVEGRRPGSQRVFEAERGDMANGLPVVVLINPGSASASEIVAAALQDHRRATIMGQRSFGKGSVQTITPLPQEGALRLTTQLYFSPAGRAIQARGIIPDIEIIPMPQEDRKDDKKAKAAPEIGKKSADKPKADAEKATAKRRREADLPGALSAVGDDGVYLHPTLSEEKCTPVGERKDRTLGCALALIHAESQASFLASVGQSPAM